MRDDPQMFRVDLVEDSLRVGEIRWMPGELAVAGVPAGRRELRPEVDERVARQVLLAKGACDAEDFGRAGERAR